MRECLTLAPHRLVVGQGEVERRLGSATGSLHLFHDSFATAQNLLASTAHPRCVVKSVDSSKFSEIYSESGQNDRDTPLETILERSQNLALFAVTLGQPVSDTVTMLFSEHDYLTATLLDTMASLITERLVESLEYRFSRQIAEGHRQQTAPTVLAYSPGYCGWHVSGQKAVFSFLEPQSIGISLNSNCMMRPLKSVSGILVAGTPEIHQFDPVFTCCSGRDTLDCRSRIERITTRYSDTREIEWTCSTK